MKNSSFKAGDKIVYPGHGVGVINSVLSKKIGEEEAHVFDITIMTPGTRVSRVFVPTKQAEVSGLRAIIGKTDVSKVWAILKNTKVNIKAETWNRRYRQYSEKLNTGSVFEIAEVVRDLHILGDGKDLSFGEKSMLEKAENLLASELAFSKAKPQESVIEEIKGLYA